MLYSTTPKLKIAYFIDFAYFLNFNYKILAYDLNTEFYGISASIYSATNPKNVENMAFPGILKGKSLASSEGRNPVFNIPV